MNKKNKEEGLYRERINPDLVRILKQAREEKKLTQTELALKLDLNQSSIAKIEAGQVDVPVSRLIEMARVLGFEVVLVPKEKVIGIQALIKSTRRQKNQSFKDLLGVDEIEES